MVENNQSYDEAIHYRLGVCRERGLFKVCKYDQGNIPIVLEGYYTSQNEAVTAILRYYTKKANPPPPIRVKRPVIKYRKNRVKDKAPRPTFLSAVHGRKRSPLGYYLKEDTNG